MAAPGLQGQSVSSGSDRTVLFGGFDDHLIALDMLTGRVERIPSVGRTVLHPWTGEHFVALEDALGRPSNAMLTLRPLAAPDRVVGRIGASDLPCEVAAIWSDEERLVPGHFPTVFQVGGGAASSLQVAAISGAAARVEFVTGVFRSWVPVLVDGRLERLAGPADSTAVAPIVAYGAVGRGDAFWLGTTAGLAIVENGELRGTAQAGDGWRPEVVEHDPQAELVLVASWNRWGSLGGPSTDLFVLTEAGELVGVGKIAALASRLAAAGDQIAAVDVAGEVHVAPIRSV